MKIKRKTKILLIVIWVFLLLDIGVYLTEYRIEAFITAKLTYSLSRTPELYVVPEDRIVQTYEDEAKDLYQFKLYGLTFKSPWGAEESMRGATALTTFKFQDGKSILVRDRYAFHMAEEMKKSMLLDLEQSTKYDSKRKQFLREYINKLRLDSEYDFNNSLYSASPDQVSLFLPRIDFIVKFLKVSQKNDFAPLLVSDTSKIYRFDTGKIKGFQLNSTFANGNDSVQIIFYDQADNEYTLFLKAKSISQKDIDIVLSSIEVGEGGRDTSKDRMEPGEEFNFLED